MLTFRRQRRVGMLHHYDHNHRHRHQRQHALPFTNLPTFLLLRKIENFGAAFYVILIVLRRNRHMQTSSFLPRLPRPLLPSHR